MSGLRNILGGLKNETRDTEIDTGQTLYRKIAKIQDNLSFHGNIYETHPNHKQFAGLYNYPRTTILSVPVIDRQLNLKAAVESDDIGKKTREQNTVFINYARHTNIPNFEST